MSTPAKKPVPSLAEASKKSEEDKEMKNLQEELKNKPDSNPNLSGSEVEKGEKDNADREHGLSPQVVATVPNKTPAELNNETAEEAAARYGVSNEITDDMARDPHIQVYKDDFVTQIPSGAHLHPDIAKDLQNRGIARPPTDSALVMRQVVETQDFAGDAENNDKFKKPVEDDVSDEERHRRVFHDDDETDDKK